MKKHKRAVSFLTAVLMMATFVFSFTSCGMDKLFEENSGNGDPSNLAADGELSNSEWLAMINDAFGIEKPEDMDEIENAKDWGFIKEDENIDPDAPITDEFATKTLMRATGFVSPDASDEEIARMAVEKGIVTPDRDMSDPSSAAEALEGGKDQWAHKKFDYSENIEYNERVHDFSETLSAVDFEISKDGNVIMPSEKANELVKDDVFVLPPSDAEPDGIALKVLNVKPNGDGTSTVRSCQAKLEELYSRLQVSGGFSPDIDKIEPLAEDVKITSGSIQDVVNNSSEPCTIMPLGNSPDESNIKPMVSIPSFTIQVPILPKEKTLENGSKASGELQLYATFSNINLNADIDLDLHWFDTPDIDAYVTLDYKQAYGIKLNGLVENSQDFKDAYKGLSDEAMLAAMNGEVFEGEQEVARVPIQICTGLSVDFVVSFVVSANGYISFEMTFQHTKGFEMHNSHIKTISTSEKVDQSLIVSGSVGFLFSFQLAFHCTLVKEDIVAVDLRVGPVMEAKLSVYSDVKCLDVMFYGMATIGLKFHPIIEDIIGNPELTITLADDSNSPVKGTIHIEFKDGHFNVVDSCTHGQNTTTTTTTENKPVIHAGALVLEKAYYSIAAGSEMTIGIKSMPSDLELSDLVWSSSAPEKVTVDGNGNIKAVAAGSAVITVKSKDGKHTYSCTITVQQAADQNAPSNVGFAVDREQFVEIIAA